LETGEGDSRKRSPMVLFHMKPYAPKWSERK